MNTIDGYVADLGARLRVDRRHRRVLLDEVRDHLVDAAERHLQAGEPWDRAEDAAVRAFGSPAVIARDFNAAAGARAMRRATIIGLAAGASVAAAFLVAALTQPRGSRPANPAMQASFFIGVLALQVALVAGARGASRAAAVWRTSAADGEDRAFVRQCTVASMVALCAGVLSITTSLLLDARQAPHANAIALAVGSTGMVAAAAAGLIAMLRLDVNAADEDAEAGVMPSPALLGLGESVIGFASRHPVASCVAAVVASTSWAMTQAEASSFAGALPWGIGEAFTVIAAFLLLGPMLGLRPSRHAIDER